MSLFLASLNVLNIMKTAILVFVIFVQKNRTELDFNDHILLNSCQKGIPVIYRIIRMSQNISRKNKDKHLCLYAARL